MKKATYQNISPAKQLQNNMKTKLLDNQMYQPMLPASFVNQKERAIRSRKKTRQVCQ